MRKDIRKMLVYFAEYQNFNIDSLVYIHQTDEELHAINVSHLNHDTFTDIITFDMSDNEGVIDGEIYLSVDRIRENAEQFNVDFMNEYVRVVSHGLFHLMGYGDKSEEEAIVMRGLEDSAIAYFLGLSST
jgi:rRNA maturation RNase YbeY